ncbi:DUF2235 domain-containing protein [Thalassotalea euphylliae]|uniref:DUF2235 domain-containing protein n=1 Tax=Thalassotalea euphylliae TaxID=1655234 RepID=A0A3E0TXI4_9GAMM|nr:DUF2235 domain-containing protein [Thalassotalea euphylliae]REL28675.1 DUF2235 domain-containing protein [Thalassotalea euphylliae]
MPTQRPIEPLNQLNVDNLSVFDEPINPLFGNEQAAQKPSYPPHKTAESLPREVKLALPAHHSQWLVLTQPVSWQQLRADQYTRLYVKDKKSWQAVNTLRASPAKGELLVLKHKDFYQQGNKQATLIKGAAGAGQAKTTGKNPFTQGYNDQSTNYHVPAYQQGLAPSTIFTNIEQSPEPEEKRIIIKIEGETSARFTLKGSGVNQQRTFDSKAKESASTAYFAKLKEDASYQLDAKLLNLPVQTIVPNMAFSDYQNRQTIENLNIGENGGFQLLDHRVTSQGHVELTLLPEPPCFGVFFDGTGNNLTNDSQDPNDDKEPTNIAKLYELYPRLERAKERFYSEGIGTQAFENDSNWDMAFAGSFDDRIKLALDETRDFFIRFPSCKVGTIDIFGFSRGASQARAFANIIHKLNREQPDYWGGTKLMVRFIGLFDTVASIGGDGDNDHSEASANKAIPGQINLDLAENSAGKVYQLAAWDERRDKFPLNSLKTGENLLLTNHEEVELPGAHADIGGGYGPVASEIRYPRLYIAGKPDEPAHQAELEIRRKLLAEEYDWPGIDIELIALRPRKNHNRRIKNLPEQSFYTPYKAVWRRQVNNSLSHYALHQMHQVAVQHGVPFRPINKLAGLYPYELSNELKTLVESATANGPQSTAWQKLYLEYIHISVKYAGFIDGIAHGEEQSAIYTTSNGQREIFYNQPDNAETNSDNWQFYQGIGQSHWRK